MRDHESVDRKRQHRFGKQVFESPLLFRRRSEVLEDARLTVSDRLRQRVGSGAYAIFFRALLASPRA